MAVHKYMLFIYLLLVYILVYVVYKGTYVIQILCFMHPPQCKVNIHSMYGQ